MRQARPPDHARAWSGSIGFGGGEYSTISAAVAKARRFVERFRREGDTLISNATIEDPKSERPSLMGKPWKGVWYPVTARVPAP